MANLLSFMTSMDTIEGVSMESISVNRFRENFKRFVEQVVSQHIPIKVTRRNGKDIVVVSAEDWEREQETLFVLQNTSLMKQMVESARTHAECSGYAPTDEETHEILGVSREHLDDL
ncbi:MAG: type II toxin-antitoxin system Phd/YefM family antitoxin [Methylococcales bacterium]